MSTVKKHLTAIKSGRITKSNIIGIRKALNAHYRNSKGHSTGLTSPQWSDGDVFEITRACSLYTPSAVGELHDQGERKLRDKRNARYLSDKAKRVIACPYLRFELVDWEDVARGHFQPVYRAIGNDSHFDFISLSWQFLACTDRDELTPIVELQE